MATMKSAGSVKFTYTTTPSQTLDEIWDMVLRSWRALCGDPEETLPWTTSIEVEQNTLGTQVVVAVIRWQRDGS